MVHNSKSDFRFDWFVESIPLRYTSQLTNYSSYLVPETVSNDRLSGTKIRFEIANYRHTGTPFNILKGQES